MARGAEEGLALGSSFFHDSLATGERKNAMHEGPTGTDLQTVVGFVGKEKTLLSARGFQMSAMSMEGRCSQSLQTT